ncbi:hypothetical protein E0765_07060 [Sulfuricurvum sp. IAE1]|uniref:hypothetical protein n=1 Tax=Sulfuricurvum sp. IAE1 TaxID=2546102 RepID=UPI00104B9828|nr:hypothetical protein [Sulfuricurvum sp. IAE1]TDA63587.1 hypothetical protein E0765_07060 [Sulfuricurvum sp. IAE1]
MANEKKAIINTYEAQLAYDVLLRTEKIFRFLRMNSGPIIDPERALMWQKRYEELAIANAEFLEELAMDIGRPELYSDSKYLTATKNKLLQKP